LTIKNVTRREIDNNLFELKLIETGINDLLKRQIVGNLPISPNFMQNNDVSINLITSVSFLRKVCPKSYVIFQALPLFAPWL